LSVQNQGLWKINQLFLFLATTSIIFVVMKYSSGLIVPLLIAIALSILLSPIFSYMETKHIPKVVSLIVLFIIVLLPVVSLGGYLGSEVKDFSQNYVTIQKEFDAWILQFTNFTDKFGLHISEENITKALNSLNMTSLIKGLATQTKEQFSNIFLIFFLVAFILMESTYIYNKLVKVMSVYGGSVEGSMLFISKVQKYFLIKVKTSLITGALVLLLLWVFDIKYAFLWAVLAFFLNFIPVIGSILAAIPAVVIALVYNGVATGIWVMFGYVMINMIIGNILEPRIMGKGLGLSALVIFVSMTFWGWMFGPAGMILSVPLTMGMQYLFAQYDETKWIAFMMSDYEQGPSELLTKKENENGKKDDHASGT
jgi:predicted PurR-regulated permease PerM